MGLSKRIAEKVHLTLLNLCCTTRLGDDGLVKEEEGISEVEQRHIEEVFDELCPPSCLDNLDIEGYFGQRLPRWMMSSSVVPLKSLRILMMEDLACCIQLPSGLCQLPCLQLFQIRRAPSINRIGPEFLQLYHQDSHHPSQAAMVAFPRLHRMYLLEMVEWKEWEWEEKVQAMLALEQLVIGNCKLSCIPAGLASQANALKTLSIQYVKYLKSLDNFASLVELQVSCNPDLESITNLPKLQKLLISTSPKLLLLEGVPALQRLVLEDYGIKTLPEYMRYVNPRHLELECRLALLSSIATGQSGPEWDKFSHVKHIKAYAHDGDNRRKWFSQLGTLWFCEDEKRFQSVFKMTRRTFNHICSLLKEPSVEDTSSYTFLDGRLLCLEDRVAAALIVLNSGEPLETIGSSVGMNQLTVSLVTASFVDAMVKRAAHHSCWPGTVEMEMIKSMFDKTHDMRLRDSWLGWSDSMNQWSILHDSQLFKKCDKGAWLNGRKLHLYIIGDAGYLLLP
ncbi:uncharacterized protein LOC112268564 [Brachypodium distachyon]|uniref:uncharacterized protein LOC112268564 n=1 Tax=Brachypodium distachyon TaxID=15368 RepID=UPI000D0D7A7D|nr:uncharacterized protein LOC112268564 [Brachypodium distachyon]|eukprot:XP_024310307.1 uncharacterized protein LOC112268564 [Brachypodium distachyon]